MLFQRRHTSSQKTENLREWQPKDREIVSLNTFKQLHSSALEPVSADGPENVDAPDANIVIEEGIGEMSHRQSRAALGVPYSRSVLDRTNCRDELVGPAAQSLKLGAGLPEIRGLVEPYLAADQKLVDADDNGSTTTLCDLARLRLGKSKRAAGCIASLRLAGLFE
jgi:hypothetical protein